MRMQRVFRKSILTIVTALVAVGLCACSDGGRVRYADETLVRELCGLPPETSETEETVEATQETIPDETQESTKETTEESTEESSEESTEESSEESTEETSEESSEDATKESATQATREIPPSPLIGSWQSEPISVKDMVMAEMSQLGVLEPYVQLRDEKLIVRTTFTFEEDGVARLDVDEASFQALMDYVTEEITNAAYRYFDSYVKKLGGKLSTKQYLTLMGISIESYVSDAIAQAGGFDESDLSYQCLYEHYGDKVYVGEDKVSLGRMESYLVIKLKENSFSVLKYYENGKEQTSPLGLAVPMPISFTKQ